MRAAPRDVAGMEVYVFLKLFGIFIELLDESECLKVVGTEPKFNFDFFHQSLYGELS